jgi:hypothetical protein
VPISEGLLAQTAFLMSFSAGDGLAYAENTAPQDRQKLTCADFNPSGCAGAALKGGVLIAGGARFGQ